MLQRSLLLVVIAAVALHVVAAVGVFPPGVMANDVINYFYPNMLYALHSLADGGRGLLWNPYQDCGQPFLAITETGLWYPFNVVFLVLPPQLALRALLVLNLVAGGLGAYALGLEIGLASLGALGLVLAFLLGNAAYHVTSWMPTVQAPYMWMPAAMCCCERLVKRPSVRTTLMLGIVLALALLPGHPQFVLFTCQLLGMRLLWACFLPAERRAVPRAAAALGLAVVLMLLLTAVQFYPSVQLIAESVRHSSLRPNEITPGASETLHDVAASIIGHTAMAPFGIPSAILAVAAIARRPGRATALFYLLSAVLFLVLSLGATTPLGRFYYALPMTTVFRWPLRFRLISAFCTAVLAGIGIDTLAAGNWRGLALAGAAAGALALALGRLSPANWAVVAALCAAGAAVIALPGRAVAARAVVAVIPLAALITPIKPWQHFLADDAPLREHAAVLDRLRARLTPQDRVRLAFGRDRTPGFEEKTPTVFRFPATTDYETQMLRRYAEFDVKSRAGNTLTSINQVYYPGVWSTAAAQWPMIDLSATRFIVMERAVDTGPWRPATLPLNPIDEDARIRVYENRTALPRAYYVPQIAVEPDADRRLDLLAHRFKNPRRVALVNEPPASGFLGTPDNFATAEAHIAVDEPERVIVETDAPERGFLFLADAYYPEWAATVNGEPTPIQIANHAFRLVEVPKGRVTVEFRYRPRRVWIGGVVSALTIIAVVAVLVRRPVPRVAAAPRRRDIAA
jgi:hypothetical protein